MTDIKRTLMRVKGIDYVRATLKLVTVNDHARFSLTGERGHVLSRKEAKARALESWESYFEDNEPEIYKMGKRTARSAAKAILALDGDYHGIDAREVKLGRRDRVLVAHSFGQIQTDIRAFFPELVPLFPWHLNDMRAGCEHQRALGWGHGKTIALAPDMLTPAQQGALQAEADRKCEQERDRLFKERWGRIMESDRAAWDFIQERYGKRYAVVTADIEDLRRPFGPKQMEYKKHLREQIDCEVRPKPFEGALYKDCLSAPCPECGYFYGSQWLVEPIPEDIVNLIKTVCKEDECED